MRQDYPPVAIYTCCASRLLVEAADLVVGRMRSPGALADACLPAEARGSGASIEGLFRLRRDIAH
jgi:hypothetical protein